MKLFYTALVTASILSTGLALSAHAQTATPNAPATSTTDSMPAKKLDSKDVAEAEVRKVDKDAKKITLKHGPIKNLDMPSMTMVFQVKDTALLDKLAAGDRIMFTAEQQQGAYVMTGVEKVAPK